MNGIKIRIAENRSELKKIFKIRETVFAKEQKVPRNIESDKFDKTSKHVIVNYGDKSIGCARVRFVNGNAKLERIAVLKSFRGKGIGKIMMNYLINYCKKKKSKGVYMNAQYYLKDYYKKFGFKPKGNTFMEAGIKHIKMHLK